jgi:hypothetical protein
MFSLVDALQVCAGLGVAVGGLIGLVVEDAGGRRLAENIVLWSGVGLAIGTMCGFGIWAAVKLNGGLG